MPGTNGGRGLILGAVQCVGLGFLAGALESVGIAATCKLPLGFGGFAVLAVIAVGLMGAVGFVAGLVAAIAAAPWARGPASGAIAVQMGVAGTLLCGFYLWEGASLLFGDGRAAAGAVMAVMPAAFGGVVYYNARYWLRRAELGLPIPVGWLPASLATALLVGFGSAATYASRYTGGSGAIDSDPTVVLITVDGLRRDDVGAFGGQGTPRIDALAASGVVLVDAVTPMPASAPANATVVTGLHPLRHGVLEPGDTLPVGVLTVAEILGGEGYTTGGFASGPALAAAGLDRGFYTWDDGRSALAQTALVRRLGRGGGGRPASQTTDAFLAWNAAHADRPGFGWVQYDASEGVAAIDAEVGRVLDAVPASSMVVLAGTYGVMRGEHDLTGPVGLFDEVVRVPVVVRAPGVAVVAPRVGPQVRLMDVAETLLAFPKIDHPDETEGVSLLDYATGARKVGMWSALVGRSGPELFDSALLGMRNNGVKYVREIRTGRESLFDLGADPGERVDLSADQTETVERARGMVVSDEAALRRRLLEE